MLKMSVRFLFLFFILIYNAKSLTEYTDKFFFKFNDADLENISDVLKKQDYIFHSKIVPGLYVFRNRSLTGKLSEDCLQCIKNLDDKIQTVEQVRRRQVQLTLDTSTGTKTSGSVAKYGMGIEDAWKMGMTGEGVILAVLDVGVDTTHPYLNDNIDLDLSWNFLDSNSDVTPDYDPNYIEFMHIQDHGTNVCGLLSAYSKKDGPCAKGVAFRAKQAMMKVVLIDKLTKSMLVDDDNIALGLTHKADKISIYVNPYCYDRKFQKNDIATEAALESGAKIRRYGKGSLFVYPSAKIGSGLENNIYTIVVSGVGLNGSIPASVFNSAAVLTSALAHGCTLTSEGITTTTGIRNQKCTKKFGGTSAATAFVSAILALVLQANPDITYRDMMHIIVQSSEHNQLTYEFPNFKPNAAGKYFHAVFGFGLLNAGKAVSLARSWTTVEKEISVTSPYPRHKSCIDTTCSFVFDITCDDRSPCVSTVEQVRAWITCQTSNPNKTSVYMTSPSRTQAILVQKGQMSSDDKNFNVPFRSVNFWGECSIGLWTINIEVSEGILPDANVQTLTVFGTGKPLQFVAKQDNILPENGKDKPKKSDDILFSSPKPSDTERSAIQAVFKLIIILILTVVFFYICRHR